MRMFKFEMSFGCVSWTLLPMEVRKFPPKIKNKINFTNFYVTVLKHYTMCMVRLLATSANTLCNYWHINLPKIFNISSKFLWE